MFVRTVTLCRAAGMLAALLVGSLLADAATAQENATRRGSPPVSVLSAGSDSVSVGVVNDLVAAFGGGAVRVLPVVGRNAVQNVSDLLFVKEIDMGIVPSDVLGYLRREQFDPKLETYLRAIAKLYEQQVHVLARRDVNRIEELAGRRVSVGMRGGASDITATLLFDALGVRPELVFLEPGPALDKVKRGEIAALVHVGAKPDRLFFDLNRQEGFHFLGVPRTSEVLNVYKPAVLGIEDYPLLVGAGEAGRGRPIETVAVDMLLVTANAPPGTERYRKVSRFVEALNEVLPSLALPARDARLRTVDPNPHLRGWAQFEQGRPPAMSGGSSRPPQQQSAAPALSDGSRERDALFQQFLRWREVGGR